MRRPKGYDIYTVRKVNSNKARDGVLRYITDLQGKDFWIGALRLTFQSSALLYPIGSNNPVRDEQYWSRQRDYFGEIVQQWLYNAFRGNTQTQKRDWDRGWTLIGFWDHGRGNFLHAHVFLAVDQGPTNACRRNSSRLIERLEGHRYHPGVAGVHLAPWRGSDIKAVNYASKGGWRPGSGEDLIFARAESRFKRAA